MKKKIVSLIIAVILLCSSTSISAFANEDSPKLDMQSILEFLSKYNDNDGYYLLKNASDNKANILEWWRAVSTEGNIAHNVRNGCDSFNERYGGYYLGDGKYLPITNHIDTFKVVEIAESIPEEIRCYTTLANVQDDTPVAKGDIYWLLNEFDSEYFSTKTYYNLYPRYEEYNDYQQWMAWINSVETFMVGCYEYKYEILKYILYAKENHPDVYEAIIKNNEIRQIYSDINTGFIELTSQYVQKKKDLIAEFKTDDSMTAFWDEFLAYYGDNKVIFDEELHKQMYIDLEKQLKPTTPMVAITPEEVKASITLHLNDAVMTVTNGSASKTVALEAAPYAPRGTTLVPVRAITEAFGFTVKWDGTNKEVLVTHDKTTIKLKIGSKTAYVNGNAVEMLDSAQIINGKTVIPLRFISENMGYKVEWDKTTSKITISN